jgi:hypothetical protein
MTLLGTITIVGRAKSQNDMNRLGKWKKIEVRTALKNESFVLAISAVPVDKRFNNSETSPTFRKRKLVITSYRSHLLDDAAESLAGGACKHYIDALKIGNRREGYWAGVIVDDDQRWCEREYRQVQDANERLTIEVWEL